MRYDPNGDVSQEFYEDYRKLLNSIQKNQKQKVRDSSSSYERSTSQKVKKARARSSSSGKKGKKAAKQPLVSQYQLHQSQLQRELETSLINEKRQREVYERENKTISIDNQSRFSSLKNDNAYVPSVVQEKGASLIPPQSDIATIDRHHHLDRTQKRSSGGQSSDFAQYQDQ